MKKLKCSIYLLMTMFPFLMIGQGTMVVTDPGSYGYLSIQATNTVTSVKHLAESFKIDSKTLEKIEKVNLAIKQSRLVLNMIEDLESIANRLADLPVLIKNIENVSVKNHAGRRLLFVKEDISLTTVLLSEALTSGKLNGEDFQRLDFLIELNNNISKIDEDISLLEYSLFRAQPGRNKLKL